MNNNYYWSLIAASKKKLPPIWVEYIVARAGDFSLPAYDSMQENIVADTDHLASVQLYDSNNELVANLRPCLSTEKGHYLEGCLYDVVKKKFYYSQNADVKYGDIVREVEYIQNTSSQYINTNIPNNTVSGFDIKYSSPTFTGTWSYIFGNYAGEDYNTTRVIHYISNKTAILINCNTKSVGGGLRILRNNINDIQVRKSSDILSVTNNGVEYSTSSVNGTNQNFSCYLFGFNNGGAFKGDAIIKVYLLRILQSNIYTADYMPCILSDGTVCMWDWISGEAKKNAGTGEFVAGKDMNDLFNVVEKEGVFLNRETGDGLNVKDKSLAHITSLKGNTLIFNQLLKEGKVVDMGLPSGTLWATCDIDVTNPDGFADTPFTYEKSFFSWGNIDGHNPNSATTFSYDWGSVNGAEPYYEGQPYGNTKGNTLSGDIPVGDDFDAARANLGTMWRMPSSTDFQELINNCIYIDATGTEIPAATTNKTVTVNGVRGLYLQSKANGNRLFFSASSFGTGSTWLGRGDYGNYWSSSFGSSSKALYMFFYSGGVNHQNINNRYYGFAVRAVLKPSNVIETGYNNHKYCMKNNKNIFDLTKMFGAGNEPATSEEFKTMFPADYDYDTGSLLNVNAGGMKSTDAGNTKWDSLYFVDDTHTLSSLTGKAEGSSVSEVIFPEGMKRINNVYDELTDVKGGCFTKAIKRLGAVDLGSLDWRTTSANKVYASSDINGMKNNRIHGSDQAYILTLQYNNSPTVLYSLELSDRQITINAGSLPQVVIRDDRYSDNTAFRESVQGVILLYELNTPIVYTLDTPVPCNYKVWKGGSEIVVPENTEALTAPVDMSVKYIVEEDE